MVRPAESPRLTSPLPPAQTCRLLKHSVTRFCCAGCHRAFSSMVPFNAHRGRRSAVCLDPATLLAKDGTPRFVTRSVPGRDGPVLLWGEPSRDSRWGKAAVERIIPRDLGDF